MTDVPDPPSYGNPALSYGNPALSYGNPALSYGNPALPTGTIDALRAAGARFALLHGSRAAGTHRPDSDVDVAAWWSADPPPSFEVDLPPGVDLLVLNDAPLELAGRVAQDGRLLFDDDPPARVRWVATLRKIYADELPRMRRSHQEFLESLRRG